MSIGAISRNEVSVWNSILSDRSHVPIRSAPNMTGVLSTVTGPNTSDKIDSIFRGNIVNFVGTLSIILNPNGSGWAK